MIFGVFEKNYLDFLITQFSVREVGNETVIVSVEIRLKLFKSCVANMSEWSQTVEILLAYQVQYTLNISESTLGSFILKENVTFVPFVPI